MNRIPNIRDGVLVYRRQSTHFKCDLLCKCNGIRRKPGKFTSKHATFSPIRKGEAGLMDLPSHVDGIHASWTLRYLPPRTAQWKQVLDNRIDMPRYALLHLTQIDQQQLLQRISHGHHLMVQALKAFLALKLNVRDKGSAALVRAIAFAHDNFFQFSLVPKPPKAEAAWDTRLAHCGINIDWQAICSSIGNFFTTPADAKIWFKFVLRGLVVNGKETSNKVCRPCDLHRVSQLHLLSCPKLLPIL
eukprot:76339-Pleurochrysis_carterae.AAC.7